jgi:hypothetical protein
LTEQARDGVVRAASGNTDDDMNRPRRIGLRPCEARIGMERDSDRCQIQELAAWRFRDDPRTTMPKLSQFGLTLVWFQALRFDNARRVWCLEILDQHLGRVQFFRFCANADKKHKVGCVLKLGR